MVLSYKGAPLAVWDDETREWKSNGTFHVNGLNLLTQPVLSSHQTGPLHEHVRAELLKCLGTHGWDIS